MEYRNTTGLVAIWSLMAIVAVGSSCKSDNSEVDPDEAAAVEAEQESSDQDNSESEKGAAAEGKESAQKGEAEETDAPEQATVGKPAPDFTLKDAAGNEHSLSEYEGKIVVLEWFSTECPYVKRHYKAETMSKAIEEIGGGDVEVQWLAVDSSHFANPEASKKWKEKYGVNYPILMDSSGEVGKRYGAKTTPHMYVIDREGMLRYNGAIDDDESDRKDSPTNYVVQAVQAMKNDRDVEPSSTKPYGCSVKYEG